MILRARAYAKVNLFLAVGPRRADGYHELLSLMQSVSLHDTLEVAPGPPNGPPLLFHCDHPAVPQDERNLVHRAVRAYAAAFGDPGPLRIRLVKRIPLAAGLAGGSADAAATLLALYRLGGCAAGPGGKRGQADWERLLAVASGVGADVPFCLTGGTAEVGGRGERLTARRAAAGGRLVLWKPPGGVSTADAYARLDEVRLLAPEWPERAAAAAGLAEAAAALAAGDWVRLGRALRNDLELAVLPERPELCLAQERLRAAGACGTLMSGSGPTVFALARSVEEAEQLAATLADLPGETLVTSLVPRGVEVEGPETRGQEETRPSGQK